MTEQLTPSTNQTIADFPGFVPDTVDNVQALYALTNFLTDTGDYKSTTYYQQIAEHFSSLSDQQSFALRLIIHYTGDIHQPLHTTAGVSDHYPHGDAGGNYEHVPIIDGVSTLHSVWDSVAYSFVGYASLPFNSADWDANGVNAADIASNYPVDTSKLNNGNF